MHTPEQAKLLWCPIGRVGVLPIAGGPASINDPSVNFRTNCIADQCAMWREVVQLLPSGAIPPAPTGYCGLAGRPN